MQGVRFEDGERWGYREESEEGLCNGAERG